jgi:broad specificity phosphatase PhoE
MLQVFQTITRSFQLLTAACRFLHLDSNHQVWNKVRVITKKFPVRGTRLSLTLIDEDSSIETLVRGKDVIGTVTVPLAELVAAAASGDDQEKAYEVELTKSAAKGHSKTTQVFVKLVPEPSSMVKTVFFIRHGESKWNQAQESMNLLNMLKEYDHGLSATGKVQAVGLAQDISASVVNGQARNPDAGELLSATRIFCSPLTRAIQTSLIGLQAHPVMRRTGLVLTKDVREIKKIGGFDTVGIEQGAAKIRARVLKEMKTLYPTALEEVGMLTGVAIDAGDATNEWWTPPEQADSKQAVESRIDDLFLKLQFAVDDTIIVTGHSLLWKHMYKTRGSAHLGPEAGAFGKCKMPNCGVVKCEIDFSKPRDRMITSLKLLFGKQLLGQNPTDHEPDDAGDERRELQAMSPDEKKGKVRADAKAAKKAGRDAAVQEQKVKKEEQKAKKLKAKKVDEKAKHHDGGGAKKKWGRKPPLGGQEGPPAAPVPVGGGSGSSGVAVRRQ